MVALDQRPPIANLIAARRGIKPHDVTFGDMVAVKRLLVEALGGRASAMLFDPNFALPAAIGCLPGRTGLLVTLEDHRFEDTPGGRKSRSISDWTVEKIKRAGADGVKVLAWYRPDAAHDVLAHQRAYVAEVGAECRRWDIPFVLELLVYPFAGRPGHDVAYAEAPGKQPELVVESVREFAKPHYGVDLFKLESPVAGATLPQRDGGAGQREAQQWFDRMGSVCRGAGIPWVMLSAGVTPMQFLRVMEYAYTAGANGFLAGRAVWWNALQHYPDVEACARELSEEGGRTLAALGDLTGRSGHAWLPDYSACAAMQAEGDFCAAYA